MPEQPPAGPSRPPQLVQPVRSPTRSRSLASLLKGKESSSNDSSLLSPVSPSTSSSMRRGAFSDDSPAQNGDAPPLPTPKLASGIPLTDPLLHAARAKMSSQDQEAMRKLRSTMVELSDEGSSKSASASASASASNSPNSPMFPGAATPSSAHQLRPRRSTLSRLVVPEEETPSANPLFAPAQYHIAILGHPGVGKTTLLNRAFKTWGVSPPDNAEHAAQNVTIYRSEVKPGGKLKLNSECELLEVSLADLNLDEDGPELFPSGLPRITGAVVCYDAGSKDSLRLVPEAIHRLVAAGIPTIMYACKSDPDAALQVDAAQANSVGEAYNVGLIEVTDTTGEGRSKMRNGMRWLLYKMEQRLIRRRRKASGSPTSAPTALSADSDGGSSGDHIMWPAKFGMTPGALSDSKRGSMTSEARSSSSDLQWIVQSSGNTASKGGSSASNAGASKDGSADTKPSPNGDAQGRSDTSMWVGLQDLFNQLFSKIVSSTDELFVDSFFITYRRFCQPREVMAHFLDRYKCIEGYSIAQSSKNWTMQRLTGALIDWTTDYPGDLADIVTQNLFRQIVQLLVQHTFMAHLTATLAEVESRFSELHDVDSSWAIKLSESTVSLKSTQSELVIDKGVLYDLDSPVGKSEEVLTPLTKEQSASVRTGSTTSLSMDSKRNRSGSLGVGSQGDERMVKAIDEAGSKWSGALGFVLNTDPKVFAAELTKRQWQLFAAIRPRDVFRHDFGKEKEDPVGNAITFFNHLSRWVSTVILADPKAKYRARAYERFMMIAHELRRLNNYDSLYALMSGIQETSIHRLSQTHALVQPPIDVAKNFQSHSKLMDARGNYTHYQRALRADIDAGRSAIPLITTLISLIAKMQSVRREDIRPDGTVQWDKFMRFGEVLAIIPKCQARGAIVPGTPSKAFMTILHNVPVIHDEDGLFDRSRMLEPPGAAYQQPNVLKRFGKLGMA